MLEQLGCSPPENGEFGPITEEYRNCDWECPNDGGECWETDNCSYESYEYTLSARCDDPTWFVDKMVDEYPSFVRCNCSDLPV